MSLYRFEQPELLWLLLLIPLFALLKGRKGQRPSIAFPAVGLAKQVAAFVRSRPGRFRLGWRLLALACFVVALARPQAGNQTQNIETNGIDIMLAVDLSGSMDAYDFKLDGDRINRLGVAKKTLNEFIEKRPNDRIGIIAFAKKAYMLSPLTLNHEWLQKNVEKLELGLINGDGTAIGDGVATAVNRLRDQKAKSRIIVLLTDGTNNAGKLTPKQSAEAAKSYGIKIYTIGAAQSDRAPFPLKNRNGKYITDRHGNKQFRVMPTDLDMQTLEEMSQITGAKSYRAKTTKQLRDIYEDIDQLEKTEIKLNIKSLWKDYFWIPLLGGLLIILLEQILINLTNRRVP